MDAAITMSYHSFSGKNGIQQTMAEPLKNLYNKKLTSNLSNEIVKHYPAFDQRTFDLSVFDNCWKGRQLKQRMRHITECLHQQLPENYEEAIDILIPVAEKFNGFEYMFFQDYVECYGLDDFDTSMSALEHFTKYASSEFAIRAFILQDEARTMKQMLNWARSDNHHVRRLASEGCRPRLPWAIALPAFKKDPRPVLKVLDFLMNDNNEYVRRSVANNLNDISKDNPDIVVQWAERWLGKNRETDGIIKHACRTLLKAGDQHVLSLFGFTEPGHIEISQFKLQPTVSLGEKLEFSFKLSSNETQGSKDKIGMCRIEFAIDFVKANRSINRKVFKIAEADYPESKKAINRYFSFKEISTRRYYAGKHRLSIIINGVEKSSATFVLAV